MEFQALSLARAALPLVIVMLVTDCARQIALQRFLARPSMRRWRVLSALSRLQRGLSWPTRALETAGAAMRAQSTPVRR